ncbi:uncharacterized protein LOC111353794 [Spodoptera litura]|uniref:Uncharacterized protein LOC111353794 n=1 Tax=Spodoptera litura TaxID=69820 RepID=A0A9J7E6K7_SPOLT|nr:uncharacterized protein LOC111353794 [Spodoptera litura]
MKFTLLRQCIKDKNFSSPHILSDCDLVVDGDRFFKDTYRKSECQYILGPDCDKYAEFITNKLSIFLNSHVKCHFIFRGAIKSSIDKRKEIHERIVYDQTVTKMSLVSHFQPLFVQDIQKQVLEEMDIKYFVCEYDSMEAIIGVAKKLKCPVLTDTLEYSLFGVSCIPTQSVLCVRGSKTLICTIYDNERAKNAIGVYNKTPMLLTLLNESGSYYEEVSELTDYMPGDFIWPVVKWVKRQREGTMVSKVLERIRGEEEKDEFKNVYERIRMLYEYPFCNLAVKYFQRNRVHGLYRDDKKWFAKGISDGRIAPAYIDLKQGVVLGSTLMNDPKRPDALLAALEIVCYSHCLLTNSQSSTITFVGRRADKTVIQEIYSRWNKKIQQRDIFTKQRDGKRLKSVFTEFVEEVLPGSDFRNHLLFVPVDCWLLIITLVYYIVRKNKDFINAAYCILLSYIVLGPVSKEVDKLKKGESDLRLHDTDSMSFYDNLKCMFKKVDLHQRYDSSTVHSFSEFQHCLQYMNYLNKLCGENIPCTVYHDTYNATFIYNTLMFMENKNHLMKYLKSKVAGSRWLDMYKKVVSGFENCLSAVEKFDKYNVESRVSIKMNYKVW